MRKNLLTAIYRRTLPETRTTEEDFSEAVVMMTTTLSRTVRQETFKHETFRFLVTDRTPVQFRPTVIKSLPRKSRKRLFRKFTLELGNLSQNELI